jgi:hypothetical protein
MATPPTEPAPVLDEDRRGRTEWQVERMPAHPARHRAMIRAPAEGRTAGRVPRWPAYAAVAALAVALLALVVTGAAVWLR